ncbi:MFS transporter [Asanoa siamensis]|uniref:MFS transporter n=1 Tax=Asanoa siamensis TaxID=926357 RepID=A0ABQ4D396_9ACTN|nr:MFS transporter [Asanoa siamensis]GIF78013.1 MFS transporter [Asanoa siamensis]
MRRAQQATPHKTLALALLAVTQFVLVLDASIVNVALPSIGRELNFSQDSLSWVTNAYTLAFGGFLLLGGRISDLLGRRRMFVAGLALFVAASFVGALAQNPAMLVTARAAQGLGAALVAPAALSLLMTIFPAGAERNRALGVWGAVAGGGAAAGSILGGLLTEWIGWEAVLWVNVPIGIAALALAPRLLPAAREAIGANGFDVMGAITVTAGVALGVFALVDGNSAGWGSAQTIASAAIAIALLIAFIFIESRAKHPLVPLHVFKQKTLRSANLIALTVTAAVFPMFFVLTLFMQQVWGYSPIEAGFGQLPFAITLILFAGFTSKIVTRIGFKTPLLAGMIITAGSLVWLALLLTAEGSYWTELLGPSLLAGVGGALMFIPVTLAATAGARSDESGLASGLINTTQQVGGSIGLAIAVAIATAATTSSLTSGNAPGTAATDGFQLALLGGAALAALGALFTAWLLPGLKNQPVPVDEEAEERTVVTV